jgi:hypothetical protein
MLTGRGILPTGSCTLDKDVLRASIAARLDALLDENERSAADIGREFGHVRGWLSNLRRGKNMPRIQDIPDLVRILGCTADELLGITPAPQPAVAEPAPKYDAAGPPPEPTTWRCPVCGSALVVTRAAD